MDGSWHIIKWIWVAICFIWIAVQTLAIRRLKGDLKRRSHNIGWVMLLLLLISDWIGDVFENLEATRISRLTVGVAAIVATILLVQMLSRPDPHKITGGSDSDVEGRIQTLKLN